MVALALSPHEEQSISDQQDAYGNSDQCDSAQGELTLLHYAICVIPLMLMFFLAMKQKGEIKKAAQAEDNAKLGLKIAIGVSIAFFTAMAGLKVYNFDLISAYLPENWDLSDRTKLLGLLVVSVFARYISRGVYVLNPDINMPPPGKAKLNAGGNKVN